MPAKMHPKYKFRVRTAADLKELDAHGTPLFPCACYDGAVKDYFTGQIPWHWHEELELFLVTEGKARVQLDTGSVVLNSGECILLNTNAMHSIRQAPQHPLPLSLHGVPSRLDRRPARGGSSTSGMCCRCSIAPPCALSCFPPNGTLASGVLRAFSRGFSRLRGRGYSGFEFRVRDALSRLWRRLVENFRRTTSSFYRGGHSGQAARLKAMLDYIHAHYSEHITLPDIAAAANISERECCRCFEKTIGMAPVAYVVNYRICAAAVMLEETDLPITTVAERAGFNSPSYFSKVFRRQLNCSPKEYRDRSQTIC